MQCPNILRSAALAAALLCTSTASADEVSPGAGFYIAIFAPGVATAAGGAVTAIGSGVTAGDEGIGWQVGAYVMSGLNLASGLVYLGVFDAHTSTVAMGSVNLGVAAANLCTGIVSSVMLPDVAPPVVAAPLVTQLPDGQIAYGLSLRGEL